MKQIIKTPLLLITATVLAASCRKTETTGLMEEPAEIRSEAGGFISFNMDSFVQNIKDTYGPKTVGFSYSISAGDNIVRHGAMGLARIVQDGHLNFTSNTRKDVHSVTKFFTAAAAYKLLELKGKTDAELIKNYLPVSWTIHSDYNTLTFRDILTHQSGFPDDVDSYNSLKTMMTKPQVFTSRDRVYNNSNFTLCRILLPYLLRGKAYFAGDEYDHTALNVKTAFEFREILRQYVLQPAGLTYWNKAEFKDWHPFGLISNPPPRYYRTNDPEGSSQPNGDDLMIAGGGGLVLSANEVVQVLTAFEKDQLVSVANKNIMKTFGAGFDGLGLPRPHGTYYWKNGGAGGECIIMIFPNGIRACITTNSRYYNSSGNKVQVVANPTLLANAYDDAWQ